VHGLTQPLQALRESLEKKIFMVGLTSDHVTSDAAALPPPLCWS